MRLLNIESSPRGLKSASIAISNAFIEAYRKVCPEEVLVDTLNVWDEKLPDFDQEAIGAKYKGVNMEPMDPAERALGQDPRAGGTLSTGRPNRPRSTYVELRLSLQAKAAHRSI
jgi:hypothetical protein